MEPATTPLRPTAAATRSSLGRRRAPRSVLQAVLSAEQGAPLFRSEAQNPYFCREWGHALQEPVQAALASSVRERPEQLARILAPALGHAFLAQLSQLYQRRVESISRWASGLSSPQVWRWSLQALWEGERVWDYTQQRAAWYEVVELALYDASSRRCLASCGVADPQQPLDECIFPDLAGLQPHGISLASHSLPVLILAGSHCRLAARVAGNPPAALRQQLMDLCYEQDSIITRIGSHGPHVAGVLERALQRGMYRQGPFSTAGAPRVMATAGLALCALLGLLISWLAVQEYRWQSYISCLQAEPGIQVLDEERLWGRHTIIGLRDPRSRAPEQLAAEHGLDPARLTLNFKPFLSAEEALLPFLSSGTPRPVAIAPSTPAP